MSKNVSIGNVFRVLSDHRTERLFIAISQINAAEFHVLIAELGLSRKQYYNRINNLLNAGLIRRHKGAYELSSFGKVIFSLYKIAAKASGIYWKLDAIDNIKTEKSRLAELDYLKIIDILLRDIEIKEFFLHEASRLNDEQEYSRI